jgi:hypothetical protein
MNSFFNYAKTKRETGNKKYTVYMPTPTNTAFSEKKKYRKNEKI